MVWKALSKADEDTLLQTVLRLAEADKELDQKIIIPLVRRRAREGFISNDFRDQVFRKLNVIDLGNQSDECWIDAKATSENNQLMDKSMKRKNRPGHDRFKI